MILKDIFLIPNLITLSRLFITIYIFITREPEQFSNVNLVILIAIIGISDSIDGIVARKLKQVSKLGIILDPVTDRIVFVLLILWLSNFFDISYLILLVLREILVSIGGLYVLQTKKTVKVSNKGKIGTALIFITLCLSVINLESMKLTNTFYPMFIDVFLIISIIFYYYVALEYLYKLIKNNE